MNKRRPLCRFLIIIAAFIFVANSAFAVTTDADVPDFRSIFSQLVESRNRYNELSDSMQLPLAEDVWTDLALRRANSNFSTYEANQKLIDEATYYFLEKPIGREDATSGLLKLKPGLPHAAFDSLYVAMYDNVGALDPFLGEIFVGNILIPHDESIVATHPEIAARLTHDYFAYADCLYNMYCLGDTAAMQKSMDMYRRSIDIARRYPKQNSAGYYHVLSASHLIVRFPIVDDMKGKYAENAKLYADIIKPFADAGNIERLKNDVAFAYNETYVKRACDYQYFSLRALILEEDRHADSPTYQQVMRRYLNAMKRRITDLPLSKGNDGHYVMNSTRALIRARLGLMSYDEAVEYCLDIYKSFKYSSSSTGASFYAFYSRYIDIVRDVIYLINHSSLSASRREEFANKAYLKVIDILQHRPHAQLDVQGSNLLSVFIHDSNLPTMLPLSDYQRYAMLLTDVTQIHTKAHSECVSWLSQIVSDAVMEMAPDAFVGLPGIASAADVATHRAEIYDILYKAGLMHDVGKFNMADIVNNEFRHLTNHEFSIISKHPDSAIQILANDSVYSKYIDFALGHHKWYDGSKGYPVWYDNTRSQYRLLVDILTVADCIEAATNRLSRNYRRYKSFDNIMQDISSQSGTRYSPVVINSILKSPTAASKLSDMIENGWKKAFHRIFVETNCATGAK